MTALDFAGDVISLNPVNGKEIKRYPFESEAQLETSLILAFPIDDVKKNGLRRELRT